MSITRAEYVCVWERKAPFDFLLVVVDGCNKATSPGMPLNTISPNSSHPPHPTIMRFSPSL